MRSPPDGLFARVRDTDPDCLDPDEIDGYLRAVAELRAWCDAREVRATRRQRTLADEGRAADPRHGLADHGRLSSKQAAVAADREQVCTSMPGFEDALSVGDVAAGHVDAIAQATRHLDAAERSEFVEAAPSLLGAASRQSVDTFAKGCRDLARDIRARHDADADVDELERQKAQVKVRRWIDRTTGMHHTHIEADPESDRLLWAAIQTCRRRRHTRQHPADTNRTSYDRLTLDSLLDAVAGSNHTGDDSHVCGPNIQLAVHIDINTLTHGRHPDTLCETDSGIPLPVATVRRMACDAGIIPIVLNGDGVVLDQGRARRLATPEQRLAISAMQATCSHPSCTVTIDDCRIHHLNPWGHGGDTDLDVLAPLCEPHHHLVHEGGWSLTMTPDRTATWTRPDGTHHWTGTLNDRHPPR